MLIAMHMLRLSSSRPCEVSPQTRAKPRAPRFVDWPLRDCTLCLDARYYPVQVRLYDDATDNHFAKRYVQRLEVENEIQLAYVLE